MHKQNNQGQKINTTAGVAEPNTLMGEKPAHQRKLDINMTHTTRKYWAEVKRAVNDG